MKGRSTAILTIRVPDELYLKVKSLAGKKDMTVNEWLKNVVASAAKYDEERIPAEEKDAK